MEPERRFDFGRAFLALALALALWWNIESDQNPERFELLTGVPVEVNVINIPPGFVIVAEKPTIQVEVRAPTRVWSRLRSDSFLAKADASRAGPGVNELQVSVESLDQSVNQVNPVPARVIVNVEEVRERTVPVQVVTSGGAPFGYAAGDPKVAPERVAVQGPVSVIQRVDRVIVELSLSGLTVPVNSSYAPIPVDQRGAIIAGVRLSPATVNVEVPVTQQVNYKQVGLRPRTGGRPQVGYFVEAVEVSPIVVTIVGEPQELARVEFIETDEVDVSALSSNTVRRVGLRVPRNVALVTGSAPQVNVSVRVSPLTTFQVLRVEPAVLNLNPGLRLQSEIGLVEVHVSGSTPLLQALASGGLRVVVDLGDLGPGQYTVPLSIQLPAGIRMEQLTPERVTVILAPLPANTPDQRP